MPKDKWELAEIAFDGKLITSVDPSTIGKNFQSLKNMRYTDTGIKGIGGMSKINTTSLANPHIRNIFHFDKDSPSESHLLVQAYDSNDANPKVYENTTAIPSQGDFSGTVVHTDASGAGRGRFSEAPDGQLAYCNGEESLIWGGDEMRCAGFVNYDSSGSFKYDFTNVVNNDKTDSQNVATITNVESGGIDANTVLMLHLDNDVTDSSSSSHSVTNNGPVTFDAGGPVSGSTHYGRWSSASAAENLQIGDHADFDFSGGTFTVDFWFYNPNLTQRRPVYYQQTDANNYIEIYIDTTHHMNLDIYSAGSPTVQLTTSSTLGANVWTHVAVVENGDNWYIFLDGVQAASSTDTDRAADYTGDVYIGWTDSASRDMRLDEYRVSTTARWTSNFSVPTEEYVSSASTAALYIGAVRPLKGIKFYIGTANTSSGTATVYYWNGSSWTQVSNLSDGTSSGGITMAQTGSMTFDDTDGSAKVSSIDETILYWYKISFDAIDSTTTVYKTTVSDNMQSIKDLWDGEYRTILSCYKNTGTNEDFTLNVVEEDYNSSSAATYMDLNSLTTSQYFISGFSERMMGLHITMGGSTTNSNAAVMNIYYWDGQGWASVSGPDDGTSNDGKSLNQSGLVSWTSPDKNSEFKRSINGSVPLYYYKIDFSAALDASVHIDYIAGITAQKDISDYKFPVFAHNRLFLCSDQKYKKNSVLVSAEHTASVFNGEDSTEFLFNDDKELTAGIGLFSQFGSNLYNLTVFCKKTQTWVLIGNNPEDWVQYLASDKIGCVAPLTMASTHVGFELVPTQNRFVAIWQAADGIYLFDGVNMRPIHEDIKDLFNPRSSTYINRSNVENFVGFIDERKKEYHWLFSSGDNTDLDKEMVYDIKRQKWYETDRGTGKALQCGSLVTDTNGNTYVYGAEDNGYIQRLEKSGEYAFDGNPISHEVQTGDIAIHDGQIFALTRIRKLKLLSLSVTNTANSITATHYGDSSTTGTSLTMSPSRSGHRLISTTKGTNLGNYSLHSFKFTISTNNENIGFEPIAFGVAYDYLGKDLN